MTPSLTGRSPTPNGPGPPWNDSSATSTDSAGAVTGVPDDSLGVGVAVGSSRAESELSSEPSTFTPSPTPRATTTASPMAPTTASRRDGVRSVPAPTCVRGGGGSPAAYVVSRCPATVRRSAATSSASHSACTRPETSSHCAVPMK